MPPFHSDPKEKSMFSGLAKSLFGSSNDRYVNSIRKIVDKINAFEPAMQALDDAGLQAQTQQFRDRLGAGETLDEILPDGFATVREAWVSRLGRHYFAEQMGGGVGVQQRNA